ncbi:MAG: outer membrane lipoprotein carrier protein LolA [bacterium]
MKRMKQKALVFMLCSFLFSLLSRPLPAAGQEAAERQAAVQDGAAQEAAERQVTVQDGAQKTASPANPDLTAVLSGLQEKMSRVKTLATSFSQEKNLAVFDRKLMLTGAIFIQKPNLFAWHVKEPVRYSLIIKDNSVTQWDEDTNKIQHVSLSKNTGYKIVTQQLREWFCGTYTSLLEQYNITMLSSAPVCLVFHPRQNSMADKAITSVTVTFDKDEQYIKKISIEEKNKDSTLLTFTDTKLNVPIDATAWEAGKITFSQDAGRNGSRAGKSKENIADEVK